MVARPTKRFQSFDDISENKKFLRIFTSRIIPITTWLPDINHNIKCPFHDDSTASARIYHDKDCVRLYCFPGETKVSLVDGSTKSIKDINLGEEVKTGSGKGEVLAKYNLGKKKIVRIVHSGGVLECTADHPIAVLINGEIMFKNAEDLDENDTLIGCE